MAKIGTGIRINIAKRETGIDIAETGGKRMVMAEMMKGAEGTGIKLITGMKESRPTTIRSPRYLGFIRVGFLG